MAAKAPELKNEEAIERMAQGSLTTAVQKKSDGYKGPRVRIFLPELENSENEGIEVDQYEHVTIANETGEENFRIKRGEYVEVPVPVYIQLKNKFPGI